MNLIKLLLIPTAYAQTDPIGTIQAPASIVTGPSDIYKIFNSVVNLLVVVAGIWFLVQIILAGFNYITGAGDSNKTGEAMKKSPTPSLVSLLLPLPLSSPTLPVLSFLAQALTSSNPPLKPSLIFKNS